MTTKFTKGPWVVEFDNQKTNDRTYVATKDSYICKMMSNDYDANIIACAPEMYEMLDEISDSLLEGGVWNCTLPKRIEELLAKARGEA